MENLKSELPEPWLRGTVAEIHAVPRAAVHALQLANEDIQHWCCPLSDAQLNARPWGIAPVAFHIRHIARSVDRLLTYAEGTSLDDRQLEALRTELEPRAFHDEIFSELASALAGAEKRIRAFNASRLEELRKVGAKQLHTTLGGLLVHIAEHTQRHVGQAVTTSKILSAHNFNLM